MRTTLAATPPSTDQDKKPYTSPQLTTYGYVKDIVKGNHGVNSDHGQGSDSKLGTCWIAEALYGVDAPQTTLVRAWLREASSEKYGWWLFRRLYAMVGRDVAALIRNGYVPRSLCLPLFDALVGKANAAFSRRLPG